MLYKDFSIDPIVGYHQKDIEQGGIHCQITKSDFLATLTENPKYGFVNLALKAKISFIDDIYWVDNNRTIYSQKTQKIWHLDKDKFLKGLKNCE